MKPLTHEWVKKAEEDFLVVSQLMRRKKPGAFNPVCFHCQQCVEKYLKARLIEAGLIFPKTHDLLKLLVQLQTVEPLWMSYELAAKDLTSYAVSFRYPGENATLAEARLALKNCRSLRAEVRRSLGLKK
jgi:HEPN domain-containing protein